MIDFLSSDGVTAASHLIFILGALAYGIARLDHWWAKRRLSRKAPR